MMAEEPDITSLNISSNESHILGCVRNDVARQIVYFILEHDLCTFGEIVEDIKESTIYFLLGICKRLSDGGIISITYGQEYQLHSIVNNNLVKAYLYKYEESFRDKIANGYYQMFAEL